MVLVRTTMSSRPSPTVSTSVHSTGCGVSINSNGTELNTTDSLVGCEVTTFANSMTKFRPLPSLEFVKQIFKYDPLSGELIPIIPRKNWNYGPKSGYRTVRLQGNRYNISRICWLLGKEEDPGDYEVDHIDRNPFNNSLSNLRLATRNQQLANRRRTSKSLLPKGVAYQKHRRNYCACWGNNGLKESVCGFKSADEAALYYLWNTRHHGEFADPLPISACPPKPNN